MGQPAAELTDEIMKLAATMGARLFRNSKGMFRQLYSENKQKAGLLCPGSSDLIGWTNQGKFLAVEIKAGRDTLKEDQANFIAQVKEFGGIAGVVRSKEDFIFLLK